MPCRTLQKPEFNGPKVIPSVIPGSALLLCSSQLSPHFVLGLYTSDIDIITIVAVIVTADVFEYSFILGTR